MLLIFSLLILYLVIGFYFKLAWGGVAAKQTIDELSEKNKNLTIELIKLKMKR